MHSGSRVGRETVKLELATIGKCALLHSSLAWHTRARQRVAASTRGVRPGTHPLPPPAQVLTNLMRVFLIGLFIWWVLRIEGRVFTRTAIALLRKWSEDPTSISS